MSDYNNSKTGLGVVLCLFLGLLGLIIGVCMYPSGSYERQTFVKGWLTTLVVEIVLVIVIFVVILFGAGLSTI